MARRRRLLGVAAALLLVAVAGVVLWSTQRSGPEGPATVDVVVARADFDYLIPAGTGRKLDQGSPVDLVPSLIAARVGQTIRIANRDDRTYLLGPFIVGPHETLTQRFASPGTFTGECAVHPGGTIRLVVSA